VERQWQLCQWHAVAHRGLLRRGVCAGLITRPEEFYRPSCLLEDEVAMSRVRWQRHGGGGGGG